MDDQVGRLYIRFDADGKPYIRGLRDMENQTENAGSKMTASLAKWGKRAAIAVAAVATAMVVGSVKAASSFEYEMSRIKANANATEAELDALRDTVLQLGKDTVFSAGESAEAANELIKAGLDIHETISALPGLLDLASAGELDVAKAATITADTLNIFKMSAEQAGTVADTLALAANRTTTEVGALYECISAGAAAASLAKIDLADFTTWLAIMAENGIKGAEAGTAVKTMFMQLMAPSTVAADLMEQYSFSVYDATGKMKDSATMIADLETALAGATEEEMNFFLGTVFGTRGIQAVTYALKEGSDGFRQMTEDWDQAGAAADIAATKLDNLKGAFTMLKGSVETTMIAVGTEALGPLSDILDELTEQTNAFMDEWERLTGTDAWQKGGFEVKLDLAAGSIMEAIEHMLDRAGDAIERVDWSAIGGTLAKSIGKGAADLTSFVISKVLPAVVDLSWSITAELAKNLPEIVGQIAQAAVNSTPEIAGGVLKGAADTLIGVGVGVDNWVASLFGQGMPGTWGDESTKEKKAYTDVPGWEGWHFDKETADRMSTVSRDDLAALSEENGVAKTNEMVDALQAAGVSTGQLAEYTKTLQAVFAGIMDPASAWQTALENQGGAAKNAQRAIEDYIGELDKQIQNWATFESDLKKLASELGPEVGADAIMAAAAQGPEFVHALVGADDATAQEALQGLLTSLDNNLAGLSPEIAALCNPAGEDMADGMADGLSSEGSKAAIQSAAEDAATVDLYSAGFKSKESWLAGFNGLSVPTPTGTGGSNPNGITHDTGGYLPPGVSLSINKTGKPEPVLTAASAEKLMNFAPVIDALGNQIATLGQTVSNLNAGGAQGGGTHIHVEDSAAVERAREHGGRWSRV